MAKIQVPKLNMIIRGDVWIRHTIKPQDKTRPLPSPANLRTQSKPKK